MKKRIRIISGLKLHVGAEEETHNGDVDGYMAFDDLGGLRGRGEIA